MDFKKIQNSLNLIPKVYGSILDDASPKIVIPQIVAMVKTTKERYDRMKRNQISTKPEPWGYSINHNSPLRFKRVEAPNSVPLQVDVYCDIRWMDQELPVRQDIKVRVWSDHDHTIYQEDRDASSILNQLTNNQRPHPYQDSRVISRFHFDKANPGQNGPAYHLQFGGKAESYELCWHPEKVNIPRLEYRPMDLFLVCQMIAANFFYEEYAGKIRKKAEWNQQLLNCQKWFLEEYYGKCVKMIQENKILLDGLWGLL